MRLLRAPGAGARTPRGGPARRLKLRRTDSGGKLVEKDVKLNERVKADDVIFVKEALF